MNEILGEGFTNCQYCGEPIKKDFAMGYPISYHDCAQMKAHFRSERVIRERVQNIIESNCKEEPYEGTTVYKQNIEDEICDLIREIKK